MSEKLILPDNSTTMYHWLDPIIKRDDQTFVQRVHETPVDPTLLNEREREDAPWIVEVIATSPEGIRDGRDKKRIFHIPADYIGQEEKIAEILSLLEIPC